jgi:hypothetical protein
VKRSRLRLGALLPTLRQKPVIAVVGLVTSVALLLAFVGSPGSNASTQEIIRRAALAPYTSFLARDASGFCRSFTPEAVSHLHAFGPASCVASVEAGYSKATVLATLPLLDSGHRLRVRRVVIRNRNAIAEVVFDGEANAHSTISLEKRMTTWRVASRPRILILHACLSRTSRVGRKLQPSFLRSDQVRRMLDVGGPTLTSNTS